jgi:hypothetical protein
MPYRRSLYRACGAGTGRRQPVISEQDKTPAVVLTSVPAPEVRYRGGSKVTVYQELRVAGSNPVRVA